MKINKKSSLFLSFLFLGLFFSGCSKRAKKPGEMAFNELKEKAMNYVERNKRDEAIKHLEQLIAQYPENQDIFV